ncbi:hypothetical protein SMICM17S_09223 [Streptomyces microflavus]
MPPADAPAESDAAPPEPAHVPGDQGATAAPSATGTEDTLDLKLTEELLALIGEDRERAAATGRGPAGELLVTRPPGPLLPPRPGCSSWFRWSRSATSPSSAAG